MSAPLSPLLPFALAVCVGAAAEARAQTAAVPAPIHSIAVEAAHATQDAQLAPAAKTSPSAPGDTVEPVTVRPHSALEPRTLFSTDAASMTSPNFGPEDARGSSLTVAFGDNAVAGAVRVENPIPLGGLLASNPDLARKHWTTDLGVNALF